MGRNPNYGRQVGEPCAICEAPLVESNRGGAYCVKCYQEWKNKQGNKPTSRSMQNNQREENIKRAMKEKKENIALGRAINKAVDYIIGQETLNLDVLKDTAREIYQAEKDLEKEMEDGQESTPPF